MTLYGIGNRNSVDVLFTVMDTPRSNIREAVWRMPSNGRAAIAMGNYSDTPATATLTFSNGETEQFNIAPYATKIITRQSAQNQSEAESVKIASNGEMGRLITAGLITTTNGNFTSGIRFYDTQNVVQPNLYATNFRLKNSTPYLVLKNTTENAITAQPRFLPIAGEGSGVVQLPTVTIPANAVKKVNLTPLVNAAASRQDLDSAAVQIINSGGAGSLIGALNTTNNTTGISSDIPLRDSGPPRNSTGGYPVRLDDDFTTILSITNVASTTAKFTMQINYGGGPYALYPQDIAPGATKTFDIRKLRDQQTPDSKGGKLPLDLTVAQLRWSAIGDASMQLIGRNEIVSASGKVSSSYSCNTCCRVSFFNAWMNPNSFDGFIDDTNQYIAMQQDSDCYGNLMYPYQVTGFGTQWTSDDPNVATVNYNGMATAVGEGSIGINASWEAIRWQEELTGISCEAIVVAVIILADMIVRPRIEILRDGQVIAGNNRNPSTQNVIVGQRINLSARIRGGTVSSQQWTIPEKAIDKFETLDSNNMPDYSFTPVIGRPAAIPNNELTSARVDFIWYSGGGNEASKQVVYTVTISNVSYTVAANFDVKRPTASLTSMGGTTKVDNGAPKLYLGGVIVQNQETGIKIERVNTTIPSGFSGSFQFVQLISGQIIRTPVGGNPITTPIPLSLDGCYPYTTNQSILFDSPGFELTALINGQLIIFQYGEFDAQWITYLMFKPDGRGADWVPIQKLNWAWKGSATLAANSNPPQWTPNNISPPGNPSGTDTTEYPAWTRVQPNTSSVPCGQ